MEPTMAAALALAAALLLLLVALLLLRGRASKFELHGYQKDFLDRLGAANGTSAAEALQGIVDRAVSDPKVRSAIFDGFHCVHCGSVKPASWIGERKGKKEPYALPLSPESIEFLSGEILVPVAKVGEPKKRQVVEGPKRSDANKAARCCVDWAIKNYGAVADGNPKPE